jgi:hypothetical protein
LCHPDAKLLALRLRKPTLNSVDFHPSRPCFTPEQEWPTTFYDGTLNESGLDIEEPYETIGFLLEAAMA